MANEEQVTILRQAYETWNEWREINLRKAIDLSNANSAAQTSVAQALAEQTLTAQTLTT